MMWYIIVETAGKGTWNFLKSLWNIIEFVGLKTVATVNLQQHNLLL